MQQTTNRRVLKGTIFIDAIANLGSNTEDADDVNNDIIFGSIYKEASKSPDG